MDPDQGHSEEERPNWLPEKFEDGAALAASYSELERKFHEVSQERSNINASFEAITEQLEELQAAQQAANQQANAPQGDWYEMYERDPVGTQALLTQQIVAAELSKFSQQFQPAQQTSQDVQAALVADVATRTIASQYDDFEQYRSKVHNEVQTNPLFSKDEVWQDPRTATAALEQAYLVVKGRAFVAGEIQPETGTRDMKLAAQSVSGGQSGRPDASEDAKQAWERIKGAGGGSYADLMTPRS